jgi:hypothetical protein
MRRQARRPSRFEIAPTKEHRIERSAPFNRGELAIGWQRLFGDLISYRNGGKGCALLLIRSGEPLNEYAWLCINARMCNARSSADPCVAARHVDSRLLYLSHISWRICVADQSTDHSPACPAALRRPAGKTQGRQGGQ